MQTETGGFCYITEVYAGLFIESESHLKKLVLYKERISLRFFIYENMWTGTLKKRKRYAIMKKKSGSVARNMMERREGPCVCAKPKSEEYMSVW